MREVLEYYLDREGTRYQLRAELREAGLLFTLTVRNSHGSLFESGTATEREGDLESYDDGDGESHLVRLFRYRTQECRLHIALDIDTMDYAWIAFSESIDERPGLRYACEVPIPRVYG